MNPQKLQRLTLTENHHQRDALLWDQSQTIKEIVRLLPK